MFKRNKLAMIVAEFLGTGILTLVVLSVQRSQLGLAFFVAIAAGLAVLALSYTFGGVSGGHFNPALTFGLMTARRIKVTSAIGYIIAQLLGGWAAYGLYHYFVNTNVQAVTQAFSGRIMVAEAIGAMVFTLGWAAAAYNRFEPSRAATVAGIGLTIGIIIASAASIGVINPGVAIGVRAWAVFGSNGWLNYFLGPILGGVIGVNLFGILFANLDAPFSLGRKTGVSKAARIVPAVESPVDGDNDVDESDDVDDIDEVDEVDADDDVEVEDEVAAPIDVDKAINKNAKLGTVAPRNTVKVTKSKKSSSNKTSSKKKR